MVEISHSLAILVGSWAHWVWVQVVFRVSAACADLLSKLSAHMSVLAYRVCGLQIVHMRTGKPRSKEVEVKTASHGSAARPMEWRPPPSG